jgi:transposase
MSSRRVIGYEYGITISLDQCVGDWEPRQESHLSDLEENDFEINICKSFTGDKQDILSLILEGYNFNQISKILGIKQSKIYRIKRELMKDLLYLKRKDFPIKSKRLQLIENLIYLYFLIHPQITAEEMDRIWEKDAVLKEYRKPPYNIIADAINELKDFFKIKNGNSK